jgi:hypothetical protein
LVEEVDGFEAERTAVAAKLGAAGNVGDGERPWARVWSAGCREEEKRRGRRNGASPLAAAGLYRRPGAARPSWPPAGSTALASTGSSLAAWR